jgi:addiction module HigA family antidote
LGEQTLHQARCQFADVKFKLSIITKENTMELIHPGRILQREIDARGLSANKLALALNVPSGRITQIINGKRGVSAESALRLFRYFGNSVRFWMNLLARYELATADLDIGQKIDAEVHRAA